ncbi:hypothetical protein GCK72_011041 [Caenorhabditis remanei]|uniref:LITAF domain-containing protein n=1 Tax=Caenorhabditis remanei TaxID=31234 RepID=A0A6A5H4Y9_CAERE|nr:hypothetical protein GCK72_011041 [Caenorhabditis remanei]KAF1762778.1 hypothetical protein GCK72_011041 [Caenorhabditis remanei]
MGQPETTPVYPVTSVAQMDSAPPPYTVVGMGAAPVQVEMQPVYMQPAYVTSQPQVVHAHVVQPAPTTTTTVIVTPHCKVVQYDKPYLEYCPRCQTSVTTRTVYSIGMCWWIILCIGVFVFCWPILFCLCCAGSKDVKHYCPNCATLLAVKKRGC